MKKNNEIKKHGLFVGSEQDIETMTQIIKFTDVNVDGCGTDIEVYVQVQGKAELTNGIIKRTHEAIEKHKKENAYEYDTDSIVAAACEHLEAEGYICHPVSPDYEIEF